MEEKTTEVYKNLQERLEMALKRYRAKNTEINQLKKRINKKNENIKALKSELKKQKAETDLLSRINRLKTDKAKLKLELETYKTILDNLIIQNRRVLGSYFRKTKGIPDEMRTSFTTVLLDFEYMFNFQKLFEMHVYDYIVDRQDPDTKTDLDDRILIYACKKFSNEVINELQSYTNIDVEAFKKKFKDFAKSYTENWWNNGEKKAV